MTQEKQKEMVAGNNPIAVVRNYLGRDAVKVRFEEMLGQKAAGFMTSIVNVVRGNRQLQQCDPDSIMSSAMVAAGVDLPIEPSLGMAAMVPYGKQAQFQIMWRGVVQLCLRTNQYRDIQCTEIYRDELKGYNPITGTVTFKDPSTYKLRDSDKKQISDVVGYYARFELLSGFVKEVFMSFDETIAHAKKYSKAYQYDCAKGKQTSAWSTDPVAMGRKTVLLRLLGRWGIKSIQLENILSGDKEDFATAQANARSQIAEESGTQAVDTQFEENGGDNNAEPNFLEDADDDEPGVAPGEYICKNPKCPGKGEIFGNPKMVAKGRTKVPQCPNCLGTNLEEVVAEEAV